VTVAPVEAFTPSLNVSHGVVPFTRYCTTKSVTAEPPSLAPADHVSTTWPLPAVVPGVVGASGVVAGVALTVFEVAPEPAAFTARIRTEYAVPFVSVGVPLADSVVITIGLDVVPEARVTQFVPSVEYSYVVIAAPPSAATVN